ncbi:hypothetical protein NPX13_g6620 [Xylaria arbuscula]|uniref:Transmembrane protein n=1 Tax=Xylaria arbuscula TaxID=114810 RepID=A0A9W8NC47_9PEZI|nr:hypothetical protein NPX13_g6620 [Xylaria arbuscula]
MTGLNLTSFNDEIFTPDLSDKQDQPQHDWVWDRNSCFRPNTESGLTVICQVERPSDPYRLASQSVEYDTFEKCCPDTHGFADYENQWIRINTCEMQVCFTNNETLAQVFDQCIYETSAAKLNTTKLDKAYRGRCEWVDYDSLKRGIRSVYDAYTPDNPAPKQRVISWVVLSTTLAAAILGSVIR